MRRWLAAALVVPFLAACQSAPKPKAPAPAEAGKTVTVELDNRPFQLHVPRSYDAATQAPLVVLLHGFTSNAAQQESYFKLTAESDKRGFLYAMPDGTQDSQGRRFWNATAACCDFGGLGVDDSAYLSKLIDTVEASYSVDPRRVYFVGHSNGGFMAYRMACDHAAKVTAIVSLAGAATNEASQCKPGRPVTVLQIHGTADQTIKFGGGTNGSQPYPSVASSLTSWRGYNGCTDQADTSAQPLDLDFQVTGAETTVSAYRTGCRDAAHVELWSIQGGSHIPGLTAGFAPAVADFLLARAAPA